MAQVKYPNAQSQAFRGAFEISQGLIKRIEAASPSGAQISIRTKRWDGVEHFVEDSGSLGSLTLRKTSSLNSFFVDIDSKDLKYNIRVSFNIKDELCVVYARFDDDTGGGLEARRLVDEIKAIIEDSQTWYSPIF